MILFFLFGGGGEGREEGTGKKRLHSITRPITSFPLQGYRVGGYAHRHTMSRDHHTTKVFVEVLNSLWAQS